MPSWIETECKLLLPDAAAARRVRDALGAGPVAVQENHFFDHRDGALAAARIAVRLRAEGDHRWLTVKGDELGRPGSGFSRRIELEVELTRAEFEAALAEGLELALWISRLAAAAPRDERSPALTRLLEVLGVSAQAGRLVRIDGFVNRRERLRLKRTDEGGEMTVLLELDETRFPGGSGTGDRIDHEIEVEIDAGRLDPERVERALRRWLREIGVEDVRPAPSKLARLRAAGDRPAGRAPHPTRPRA